MRLGVLDVGSNTVHLLVVDAHPGARPLPAHSHKTDLRLAQLLDEAGAITPDGVERLVESVREALAAAEDKGVEELLPFATSAVREAANGDEVLARVHEETGVALRVISGEDEARLTFLAARRWYGWSAGRLLVLDIGGGSLEIAYGTDEEPDVCVSSRSAPDGSRPGGCPATRRTPRTSGRSVRTYGRRSPASSASSAASARPTTSSPPPRPSSSWRGWPGRPAPPRGCTSSAS